MSDPQLVSGTVQRIRHQKLDGWGVVELRKSTREALVVTGVMPAGLLVGDSIEAVGAFRTNPRYGEQFVAEQIVSHIPNSKRAINDWLLQSLPNIGPHRAAAIVERFGAELWHVLAEEPSQLLEIDGINKARLGEILAAYSSVFETRESIIELIEIGFEVRVAAALVERFGSNALEKLLDDPYYPYLDGTIRIEFPDNDAVALEALAVTESDPRRVEAVAVKALKLQLLREGHCYTHAHTIAAEAARLTKNSIAEVRQQLTKCPRLVLHGDYAMLAYIDDSERLIANQIRERLEIEHDTDTEVASLQMPGWTELDPDQQRAVELMCNGAVAVITGSPGTGKTTTTKIAVDALGAMGRNVALCAPTGKAAKRLSEATGYDAMTIHRLLEYGRGRFGRDAAYPLEADVVIVDESSMVSVDLAAALLDALEPHARIVFIGDVEQLPPVGPGMFFRDLIESKIVPTVVLKTLHRAAQESWICRNAPKVLRGETPELEDIDDFAWYWVASDDPAIVPEVVTEIVQEQLDAGRTLDEIQVITPQKKGPAGLRSLNGALQQALNKNKGAAYEVYDAKIRRGDRVVQCRNNYRLWAFNGEVGEVRRLDTQQLTVAIDDSLKLYSHLDARDLDLAYALTCHRSQGSQWPIMVVVCHSSHSYMLTRKLFYTAITRAQEKVFVVGDKKGLRQVLRNARDDARRTLLKERLQGKL